MQGCLTLAGLVCLAIGLGSIYVLVLIKGTSDGPGALFFYIGAVGGLWMAWLFLVTSRSKK
ncbi:MAG: hypothetical protein E4H41_05355 [Gemmatimonadales bacterium]|jgi:hypothetical protein|nr:MAG: hypothetical protein E4H41_05355 [Gemmatimonadales bacterium]